MGKSGGHWKVAFAVACLAAVPRLVRPDLVEYKLDEASVILSARAIIQDHVFPLHGRASSVAGLYHSPLLYYLVAPLLAIRPDPRAAVLGIALANALAVGLAYVIIARAFTPRIALFSAVMFASGSWAIIFSRKIWSIDLLPPLAVITLWGIFRAIDPKTETPGLGRSWVALAMMMGLNYSAWPLILVVAFVQIIVPRTRQGRALVWSALGAAVLLTPLAVLTPGLIDVLAHVATRSGGRGAFDSTAFSFIVQVASPTGFLVLAGPSATLANELRPLSWLEPPMRALLFLGAIVAALRVVSIGTSRWSRRDLSANEEIAPFTSGSMTLPAVIARMARSPELVVLLWWLTPAVVSSYHTVPVYIHHFADTFPSQFVLMALGIDAVARVASAALLRTRGLARFATGFQVAAGGALAAIIACIQLGAFAFYLPFVESHPLDTYFGVPLEYDLRAARSATSQASGAPVIALSGAGDTVGVDEGPTVLASVGDASELQFANGDQTLVFPASGEATYLLRRSSGDQIDEALAPWRAPGGPLPPTAVDLGGGYQETQGHATGTWLPEDWHHLEVTMEDNSTVVGYSTPRQLEPGKPTEIDVAWRVGTPPADPQRQSVFTHVVDDKGRNAAGKDFAPMPASSWKSGQTMVSRFTVSVPRDLPPGRYWVDFGRYQRPEIRPVRVVADGKPGPNSIRLGPVAVPPKAGDVPGLTHADANFGNEIRLIGWKAEQDGGTLSVVLRWEAEKPPPASYTVFVHLVDAHGKIVSQNDFEPHDGQFPTSTWKQGDYIVDRHVLPLTGVKPGPYRIELGLYTPTNGRRLPVGRGDAYTVGPITVTAPPAVKPAPRATPSPVAAKGAPKPTPTAQPTRASAPTATPTTTAKRAH